MRVVNLATILEAAARIRPYLVRTPCLVNPLVDEALGVQLFAKAEHLQVTGSFKARGAFNVVMALDENVARRGVVAHSTGNHGDLKKEQGFNARFRGH
jgi:threonine dehydratase